MLQSPCTQVLVFFWGDARKGHFKEACILDCVKYCQITAQDWLDWFTFLAAVHESTTFSQTSATVIFEYIHCCLSGGWTVASSASYFHQEARVPLERPCSKGGTLSQHLDSA